MRTIDLESEPSGDAGEGPTRFRMMREHRGPVLGCLPTLTLILVALKLLGFLQWPWIWVLAPLWIPFALYLVVMAIVFFAIVSTRFRRR